MQPEIMDKSKIVSPTNFNNYSNMTPTPLVAKRMQAPRVRQNNLSNLYNPHDKSNKSFFANYNSVNSSS